MMMTFALATSAFAAVLWHLSSPHQRWIRQSLPALAGRGSALLSAVVSLNAWVHFMSFLAGTVAWLLSIMVVAVVTTYGGAVWHARALQ